MQYFDKNGVEIKAGMTIRMEDGSLELVYDTTDSYGNPDLGINASNEEYLERHPYASREYYSLCNFDMSEVEIVDQMELPGMWVQIGDGTWYLVGYGVTGAYGNKMFIMCMEECPAPDLTDSYQLVG